MPTLLDYLDYAFLADASYVRLNGINYWDGTKVVEVANNQQRISTKFGQRFFDPAYGGQWLVRHYDDTQNPTTGFAATLFERNGKKVLGLRGTESGNGQTLIDLIGADIGQIGLIGMALAQTVSMVNYIRRLAAPAGTPVLQLKVNTSSTPPIVPYVTASGGVLVPGGTNLYPIYISLTAQSTVPGLGLLAPGEKISVTGHSLGGHLAALAARLFPGIVAEAYTYNAPGYDPSSADPLLLLNPAFATYIAGLLGPEAAFLLGAQKLTDELIGLFGQYLPQGAAPSFSNLTIHTLRSEDLAPGDDVGVVTPDRIKFTGTSFSPPQDIVTEKNSHSMSQLVDSLSLQTLLHRLDATLTDASMRALYGAASSDIPNSQERLLEALHKLFVGTAVQLPTVEADYLNAGDFVGRTAWYDTLTTIEGTQGYQLGAQTAGVGGGVAVLTGPSRDTLVSKAQQPDAEGLAYRYALKELNPFAIVGANYTPHNQNGELDLFDPAAGTGTLTDLYLADRAAFLTWKNKTYTEDTDIGRVFDGTAWRYKDEASGAELWVGNPYDVKSSPHLRHLVFGGSGMDMLTGGDHGDHLYGGAGNDSLTAGAGDDYLEGQLGNDNLKGEAGRDILIGGQGNDTLEGGAGADRLEGGLGDDVYVLTSANKANDVIRDLDGLGSIQLDGIVLTGGDYQSNGIWKKGDITYTFSPDATGRGTLVITSDAGVVTVENFAAGELGIVLSGAPAVTPSPPAERSMVGDLEPIDFNPPNQEYRLDDLGNLFTDPNLPDPDRIDVFYDSIGNDDMRSFGGDDNIYATRGGSDTIDAGLGGDWVEAGSGDDVVGGNDGRDILLGGDGRDRLYAQTATTLEALFAQNAGQPDIAFAGDWIDGGGGDDTLAGDAAADVLFGGGEGDLLLGGGGDDLILGDEQTAYTTRSWVIVRDTVGGTGGTQVSRLHFTGAQSSVAGAGGNDMLYGGSGSDWLFAGAKNDLLDGGHGNDVLMGEADSDLLYGADGNDDLAGDSSDGSGLPGASDGADYLDGGAGDDRMWGDGGADALYGGLGNDTLWGDDGVILAQYHGDDYLAGEGGDDKLRGGGGADLLLGGDGSDLIAGEDFNDGLDGMYHRGDSIEGGAGNDTMMGNGAADTLSGGDGNDAISGDDSWSAASWHGNDILEGGAGNDTLAGDGSADTLSGSEGNDILYGDHDPQVYALSDGFQGDDMLDGGEGKDTLVGGGGHDRLAGGVGDDDLEGEAGDDTYLLNIGDGEDLVDDTLGANIIEFGPGITPDSLRLSQYRSMSGGLYLVVEYGSNGDRVLVKGGAGGAIGHYRFVDGQMLSNADLVGSSSLPLQVAGTGGADGLYGTAQNDTLSGAGGGGPDRCG